MYRKMNNFDVLVLFYDNPALYFDLKFSNIVNMFYVGIGNLKLITTFVL